MAIIGNFTKKNNRYTGSLRTENDHCRVQPTDPALKERLSALKATPRNRALEALDYAKNRARFRSRSIQSPSTASPV